MPGPHHSQVAILGAGPIGLEAATLCLEHGIDVAVFERGEIAENIRDWGHVKLFSPFEMNCSPRVKRLLQANDVSLPEDGECISGHQFVRRALKPLGEILMKRGILRTNCQVLQVGRERSLKRDHIGSPRRAESPFRLLIEQEGKQFIKTANIIFDCTGTFGNHNALGNGGIPCPGEREFSQSIHYGLPDLLGKDQTDYLGQHILVIGSGYSAATNIVSLAALADFDPRTKITWVTRSPTPHPLQLIENDALVERDHLARRANHLVTSRESPVTWFSGVVVDEITRNSESGPLSVAIRSIVDSSIRNIPVDRIIANVGFRPDRTLHQELQIHECYASEGPMKLAAALLGETSANCLAQSSHGVETLKNPEPNYFICGAKSYGRNSRFLMKIGIEQIEQIVSEIQRQHFAT